MKNGKAPTREQKKMMKAHGLVPENWLVVKNLPDSLEVVSRVSLKKVGGKPKTRTISKSLWSLGTWSESSFSMTKETGQSTLKSLHRSILEKVRGHSTDTPRHTLKHPHGRTSLRRKTEQGVSSSRFSACAGSQKRPDAFQVSSRRSNRSSRIYGSMRTLPETKEPVRCCMRS